MAENNGLVSQRELSRILGVTLRAVQQAEAAGRIAPVKRVEVGTQGRTRAYYDPAASSAKFNKTRSYRTRPTRAEMGRGPQPGHNRPGQREGISPNDITSQNPDDPTNTGKARKTKAEKKDKVKSKKNEKKSTKPTTEYQPPTPDPTAGKYQKARASKEEISLERERIKLDKELGNLIEMEKVKKLFGSLAREVRQKVLNIPDRIAPTLINRHSEKDIRTILNNELKESLTGISENLEINI
jgi:hypothetical protein